MASRTRKCSEAIRAGRLAKATEFFDAAVLLDDAAPNAMVDLLVDAGIAAADVICCSRLGVHASGENHNEAVSLLESAEPGVGKHLRTLLGLKSKAAYTHQPISKDDRKRAARAAEKLVESARVVKPMGDDRG